MICMKTNFFIFKIDIFMNGEHAEEFQQPTPKESPKPQSIDVEEKQTAKRK